MQRIPIIIRPHMSTVLFSHKSMPFCPISTANIKLSTVTATQKTSIFKKPFESFRIKYSIFKFGINFVSPARAQPEEVHWILCLFPLYDSVSVSFFLLLFILFCEDLIEIIFMPVLNAINYCKVYFHR